MEYMKKPIAGYEEYSIDTNGVVFRKDGKPLKYSLNHSGYCIINLFSNHLRKGFAIHTLVAKNFIPNDDVLKTQVNHIDGNKQNNHAENLEWVTPKENTQHSIYVLGKSHRGYLNSKAKPVIAYTNSHEVFKRWGSIADAAIEINGKLEGYERVETRIWRVLSGRRNKYKGLYWFYD